MISKRDMRDFVRDLKKWGSRKIGVILRKTEKYGVICDSGVYSNGKKG